MKKKKKFFNVDSGNPKGNIEAKSERGRDTIESVGKRREEREESGKGEERNYKTCFLEIEKDFR